MFCSLEPSLFGPGSVSSGRLNLKVLHTTHLYSWLNIDSGEVPHLRVRGRYPNWAFGSTMCETATLHMDPAHLIFDVATRRLAYAGPGWPVPKKGQKSKEIFPVCRRCLHLKANHLCCEYVFLCNSPLNCTIPAGEPVKEMLFSLADFGVKCGQRGLFTDTSVPNTKARRCCCCWSPSFHTVAYTDAYFKAESPLH